MKYANISAKQNVSTLEARSVHPHILKHAPSSFIRYFSSYAFARVPIEVCALYLKSLTIKGFKSFAQPTTFALEPGVTAIVGPNGSGKSNVVDALAWVMGEQGVKTLRGGKMEDVIFAGTSTRGPLGRAEVALTIDNSDGALPIEYAEVTISRTLFRNGASEYAINGEQCRLLDVQELLSDSGLGREMHVIVGQGQLDAVLRATAEDRRGFIEEAAGILKHRRRKDKTLRKLDAMEANLTRLNDLAGEIRRQLKPLGRQAEVAKEAQTIAATVRDARARILADDVATLRCELDQYTALEQERHSDRIVSQEQLEQKQLRIARLEQELNGDEVDAARRVTLSLESSQGRLRGLFAQTNQRLTFLATQTESPELLSRVSQVAVDEAVTEAEALAADVPAIEARVQSASQHTQATQNSLDALDEQIAAQSELVSQHDLEISALAGSVASAKSLLTAVEDEAARQRQALEEATSRLHDANESLRVFEATELDATAPTHSLEAKYQASQVAFDAADAELTSTRARVEQLERERVALESRISALSHALDRKDASAALFEQKLSGLTGLVADHVHVNEGFESAIAAALGTLAEALLVDTRDQAFNALEKVAKEDLGRVSIVVADAKMARPSFPKMSGVVPAASVVQAPEGVLSILAATLVADDLQAARKASQEIATHAAIANLPVTVVTKQGELITNTLLRGGSGAAPSRIELVADRDASQAKLETLQKELATAAKDLDSLTEATATRKQELAESLTELRDNDAQLAAVSEQHNRLKAQAAAAQGDVERSSSALTQIDLKLTDATNALLTAEQMYTDAASRPRPILDLGERDAIVQELEAARQSEIDLRLALETARERVRAAQAGAESLAAQLNAERQAAEEAARRSVLREQQMQLAETVAAKLPLVIASVDRSLAEARLTQQEVERGRAQFNNELTKLRSEEAELREALRQITEDVHSFELRTYERKLSLSTMLERAGSELGLVEDVLIAEYGPEQGIPADDGGEPAPYVRDEQQKRLAKAERSLNELGRINPLALEEFEALEQRHKFLTEQLTDLAKTKHDLMQIIDELDKKMEGIFNDAFVDTKAAFAKVFPLLFPGGSGDISLTDPENLLTTGIEMTVRPAGKKVERLSLLSGGERSLAAVAWLIAIFKARPSPFYIMDEVEAALDDANLGRLLTVFGELRENSQLIVITHQKRTMEIADALYGVSMRQDGVSAVVGQRVKSEGE